MRTSEAMQKEFGKILECTAQEDYVALKFESEYLPDYIELTKKSVYFSQAAEWLDDFLHEMSHGDPNPLGMGTECAKQIAKLKCEELLLMMRDFEREA